MLGYSEIRVKWALAAPCLIYHYINERGYKPPDVFLPALRTGPRGPR